MPGIAQYRSTQVKTASPERMLALLLETAQAHMSRGRTAAANGDWDAFSQALEKAVEIVLSLEGVLDEDAAPELSVRLRDAYRYVVGRLTIALVNRSSAPLEQALRAIAPIVDGFGQAALEIAATPGVR